MSRLTLEMNGTDVIVEMSDGNSGAASVCMELVINNKHIDPDSALGSYGTIMFLDELGIYGSGIWSLYKYVCYEKVGTMIAIVRAVQLGFLAKADLIAKIKDPMTDPLNIDDLVEKVTSRLSNFNVTYGAV
jgi:hypothetical protein